jgi:hypothetical protein
MPVFVTLAMRLPLESLQIEKRRTTVKNQIRNFVVGAGLAALLWSPLLMAQDRETAEIPFDFHVGQSTLPAGTYSVIKATQTGILQLRNEDSRESILLGAQGRETAKDDPRLSFRCYSGHCFLAAVWIPGTPGYTFWKTNMEKEMEKGGANVAMAYVPLATH